MVLIRLPPTPWLRRAGEIGEATQAGRVHGRRAAGLPAKMRCITAHILRSALSQTFGFHGFSELSLNPATSRLILCAVNTQACVPSCVLLPSSILISYTLSRRASWLTKQTSLQSD